MHFKEWWNGLYGSGNFTRKELAEDVGVPVKFKDYEEDLAEAFYAAQPKPSTDFTIPLSDPNGNYLLWDEETLSWYVGTCLYGEEGFVIFTWQGAVPCFTITHWLPLPNNP